MEIEVERWLNENGIAFRRADDMKTHLDFFLPDFQVYIEVKRFHTPRIDDQLTRASDIIVVQGMACLKFLKSLRAYSSVVEPPAHNGLVGGPIPSARTNQEVAA